MQRIVTILIGLGVVLATNTGCCNNEYRKQIDYQNHQSTFNKQINKIPISNIRYILIGKNTGGYLEPNNFRKVFDPVIIDDSAFVKNVFTQLQNASLVEGKDLMLVPGRPILFMDEKKDVVCAFLYWPASRPRNMFKQWNAFRKGSNYIMGNRIFQDSMLNRDSKDMLVLKDTRCVELFDKHVSRYIDVMKSQPSHRKCVKKAGTFWINLSHDRGEQKQKHSSRFETESVKADLQLHS